jgi:hypothetical protein
MLKVAHRLLLVLIAFAIVGGTTLQLAQSAQSIAPMTMAGMPCDVMMPAAAADHGKPMTPCKGMTPDCIKQMGCVTDVALPARLVDNEIVAHFTAVDYWSALSTMAELVRTPEPLPPRTI